PEAPKSGVIPPTTPPTGGEILPPLPAREPAPAETPAAVPESIPAAPATQKTPEPEGLRASPDSLGAEGAIPLPRVPEAPPAAGEVAAAAPAPVAAAMPAAPSGAAA